MSNTQTARPRRTGPRTTVKKAKAFNLDALEREATKEQFVALVGGEEFVFPDPLELDWQDAITFNPRDVDKLMRALLAERYEDFAAHRMPVWKLVKLGEIIGEYYQLPEQGEGDASPTS